MRTHGPREGSDEQSEPPQSENGSESAYRAHLTALKHAWAVADVDSMVANLVHTAALRPQLQPESEGILPSVAQVERDSQKAPADDIRLALTPKTTASRGEHTTVIEGRRSADPARDHSTQPNADAFGLLRAMLDDPNIRFPRRPRLIEDVRVFEMPDGLGVQFHFGEAPVTFRGADTNRVLGFLLEHLDGTRTVDEIVGSCPHTLAPTTILKTLSLLHTKGVLGDAAADGCDRTNGAPTATADDVLRRQLLFWGRHIDVTRSAGSAREIQRRLAGWRIVVIGTGMFGAMTCDLLVRSGCRDYRVLAWDDAGDLLETLEQAPVAPRETHQMSSTVPADAATPLRHWLDDADFVVTATRNAPAALFRVVNSLCLQHHRKWLRANVDATRIEVGPLVHPFGSACFACLELRERSMHDAAIEEHLNQEDLARDRVPGTTPPVGEALFSATLAASLVTGEVVRVATGIAMPTLLNAVMTVLPVTGTFQRNVILRVPRCSDCFRGAVAPIAPALSDG